MEPKKTSLYLVPTPIGNMEDITLRALNVLRRHDVVLLAEDTRVTGKLLSKYEIPKRPESHHAHNEHRMVEKLIGRMLEGEVLALVSDAGTPGISDPGFLLARGALQAGLHVECLPGATAFVPALVKSGLPCDRFVFEGFLPVKKHRKRRLENLRSEDRTIILYESPYKILRTLSDLLETLGNRNASVSRELTKLYEETINAPLEEIVSRFKNKEPKGEFVIIVEGKSSDKPDEGDDAED